MKFIIKLFPEITIKSKSVRLRFTKILTSNIRILLKDIDISITVLRHWDYIEIFISNKNVYFSKIVELLTKIPGIHHILFVKEAYFKHIDDILERTLELIDSSRLIGKSFCVQVRRNGKHNFTSQDIERYVGFYLLKKVEHSHVNLTHPEVIIQLEIKKNRLFVVNKRYEGLGGFPIGTQDDVLSLISGGFDSGVASYMMIRRGCRVNYCFFNLGGIEHEIEVRSIVYHLWKSFSRSHTVRFISINFNLVINDISEKINSNKIGIVLKRMMIRAASIIAIRYGINALVTGEALGQVSSQTLVNLSIINSVSNIMILRPLISYDKDKIIMLSRKIGTENFSKKSIEYCALISKDKKIEKLKKISIEQLEKICDFSLLYEAIDHAQILNLRKDIITLIPEKYHSLEIETTSNLDNEDILIDIRDQNEQESNPLSLNNTITVLIVPFYALAKKCSELDKNRSYLLYCKKGIMSRLQAIFLREKGFNVKIYRP